MTMTAEDRALLHAIKGSDVAKGITEQQERERAANHLELAKKFETLEGAWPKEAAADQRAVADAIKVVRDAEAELLEVSKAYRFVNYQASANSCRYDRERQELVLKLTAVADPRIETFIRECWDELTKPHAGVELDQYSVGEEPNFFTGKQDFSAHSNAPGMVRRRETLRDAIKKAEQLQLTRVKDIDKAIAKLRESIPGANVPTELVGGTR